MMTTETADREIVLLCNPKAGGRWRELADIFDADEAQGVLRIVTDSVEDIGSALSGIGQKAKLLCIYGGDGTIQRILDRLLASASAATTPHLAFLGGGTMNVTSRWCGMSRAPGENFRDIVRAFQEGRLLLREVPLLRVTQGARTHFGFTFGMGPPIRVLDAYEHGRKGKAAALGLFARALAAVWLRKMSPLSPLLEEMQARVQMDGRELPYERYLSIFANVSGRLNPGVRPFIKSRTRDTFHVAAYAVTCREASLFLPFILRGWLPIDPKSLLAPVSTWKQVGLSLLGRGSFPLDPRYVNDTSSQLDIRSPEAIYTVDGEIMSSTGEPIRVEIGPTVTLAIRASVEREAAPLRFFKDGEARRRDRTMNGAERPEPRTSPPPA